MKTFKKIIPILAVLAIGLAACSGGGGSSQGTPGVSATGGAGYTTAIPNTGGYGSGTAVSAPTTSV